MAALEVYGDADLTGMLRIRAQGRYIQANRQNAPDFADLYIECFPTGRKRVAKTCPARSLHFGVARGVVTLGGISLSAWRKE